MLEQNNTTARNRWNSSFSLFIIKIFLFYWYRSSAPPPFHLPWTKQVRGVSTLTTCETVPSPFLQPSWEDIATCPPPPQFPSRPLWCPAWGRDASPSWETPRPWSRSRSRSRGTHPASAPAPKFLFFELNISILFEFFTSVWEQSYSSRSFSQKSRKNSGKKFINEFEDFCTNFEHYERI